MGKIGALTMGVSLIYVFAFYAPVGPLDFSKYDWFFIVVKDLGSSGNRVGN